MSGDEVSRGDVGPIPFVTEMELRVARAIWNCREHPFPKRVQQSWESGTDIARFATLQLARAAIRAMREPTGAMLSKSSHWDSRDTAALVWEDMIDTASPSRPAAPLTSFPLDEECPG